MPVKDSRCPAPETLAALVRWYWFPVWSVPTGQRSVQRVLQYPGCLLVVTSDYARFYGVVSGLSTTTLTGSRQDLVLFVCGRADASTLQVTGAGEHAARFKAWFPGP